MITLRRLAISNFAIIKAIDIEFKPGFTVITGETGAGKSIIINAMNMALGEQADISMIRAGAEMAAIECDFSIQGSCDELTGLLRENELEIHNKSLQLKRILYTSGRSKAWINGRPCPIHILKKAGNWIVDLHGQHTHQSLLNENYHLDYFDAFGNYEDLLEKVSALWQRLKALQEQKQTLEEKRALNREKRELWQFQYEEIKKVNPQAGEYDQLLSEKKTLENTEKIKQLAADLTDRLYEGEATLHHEIQEIIRQLEELHQIKASFSPYMDQLRETQYLFQELSQDITQYSDNIEYDPQRLETLNQRLFALQQLMKKYGSSLSEVLQHQRELQAKLNADEGLDLQLEKLNSKINTLRQEYSQAAEALSLKRSELAPAFEREMEKILERLGIRGSKFKINLRQQPSPAGWARINGKSFQAHSKGIDELNFLIRTNPGEPLRPLVNIVSGGEISRIMLAMKSLLAGRDRIPILIFDEIDVGISGKIARTVGAELRQLSSSHQIICITHLPQIAGLGTDHLSVRKVAVDNRSVTTLRRLNHAERVEELAQLLGGQEVSESSRQQARELL